jgi:hypothetical protein
MNEKIVPVALVIVQIVNFLPAVTIVVLCMPVGICTFKSAYTPPPFFPTGKTIIGWRRRSDGRYREKVNGPPATFMLVQMYQYSTVHCTL